MENVRQGGYKLDDRASVGRELREVKPGVTRPGAGRDLRIANGWKPNTRRRTGQGDRAVPLWRNPFNAAERLSSTLQIAAVVAFFVLLIACANVSNLLLVRSFARGGK